MGGVVPKLMDELLEHAAAMFVVLKLIEAGAGGREQDDVAGMRRARCEFDGTFERAGGLDGDAAGDLAFDLFCSSADEKSENGFFAEQRLQGSVVAAFILATENDENAVGKSVEGLERGVDVGGFRIVVVADAV